MNKKKSDKRPKRRIRKLFFMLFLVSLFGLSLFSAYVYLSLPEVEDLDKLNPETTALIEQRKQEAEERGEKLTIRHKWVRFDIIPKLLKDTVRISEDAAFYYHKGIDYDEVKEAMKRNLKEGRVVRGASTITQQLAKNLYLSTKRTYYRKMEEYLITQRLEKHLSKDRIFSIYLNIIEFGKGIFGVEAASEHFFKKPVNQLNLEEIIRLAAVIPKPLKVSVVSEKSRYLKWRANLLLDRLYKYGYIPESDYNRTKRKFK